ncbi:hypothetical protein QN360_09310 [Glaciimonas sp. CA11.2]|nr:hypothetical protein [Glaciimonas sp. Cout2]MEB0013975.1 hypothetical protein [Glaciimonas sp. Cout2]MEB0163105.1 hypothetical protein [Glaciimonas sp. CA11.2]
MKIVVTKVFLSCIGLTIYTAAQAVDVSEAVSENLKKIDFKITPSYYQSSDRNDATDINLRVSRGEHTGWIGRYGNSNGFVQDRIGYSNNHDFGLVRLVSSVEYGGGGYAGVSASTEIGGDTFAILGIDRTNLRPFYNLGFDPSDAIDLGIGTRALSNIEISLLHIRENRLDTQRKATHFVWRYKPSDLQRITIDTSYKSGFSDDGFFVRGYAISVTYDYDQYFVRLARDQYVNFSANNLNRLSLGVRF